MLDLCEKPNAADAALVAADARRKAMLDEMEAEMKSAARRSVAMAVKRRARRYLDYPEQRDAVAPGLWCASPDALIKTGKTRLANERNFPARRHFGFGGEVEAINAKALILVGRYGRRWWSRIERGAA